MGALVFLGIGWLRFDRLQSSAYDLAYFDQVVWNASRGHGFISSFNAYPFFGQHFSPALAALVPLYLVHPNPLWLLAAQSAALGGAVLPLYALARQWLGGEVAWLACSAYLLQLFVLRAVDADFHTEALAVPFVFWAVLAAARGDSLVLLLAGSVPMLCKEDGALVSFGVGLVAAAICRRRAGLALMTIAIAYGIVVTAVVMPAIRAGATSDLVLHYHYLGSTVPQIIAGALTRPGAVAGHLLDAGPLAAAAVALLGLALLPLLRPVALAAALPALLLALLSEATTQHLLLQQYGLQWGPLLMVAALLGWQRLRWRRQTGVVLVVAAALVVVAAGPRLTLEGLDRREAASSILSRVPSTASVAASRNLLTLLAERDDISQFPAYDRQWVVLDSRQNGPAEEATLPGHGYELVATSGDFSLWRRSP